MLLAQEAANKSKNQKLQKKKKKKKNNNNNKCRDRGSNTGPLYLQSNALPTELSQLHADDEGIVSIKYLVMFAISPCVQISKVRKYNPQASMAELVKAPDSSSGPL